MIYQTIYDLIMSTLFVGATSVEWVSLVCTVLSTACTVFVFAIPFIVVWRVMCLILNR